MDITRLRQLAGLPSSNTLVEAATPRGNKQTIPTTLVLTDPTTSEELEVDFVFYFQYDDGDIGRGTGPGKSPFKPELQLDYIEFNQNATIGKQNFKKGQNVSEGDLRKFMDARQKRQLDDFIDNPHED